MKRTLLYLMFAVIALLSFGASDALADVKYADYRQVSDSSIFVKHNTYGDSSWNHKTSGGYENASVDWPCNKTHGWSTTHNPDNDEWATWNLHNKNAFSFGEWQAYITRPYVAARRPTT